MEYNKAFFKQFLSVCPICGSDILNSILKASIEDISCESCKYYYSLFYEFWTDFTNSSDDLSLIAKSKHSIDLFRKIIFAFSMKGIHSPLILPRAMKLEVTKTCNLKCKHCLASSDSNKYKELSIHQISELLDQAKRLGVGAIGIVGGEPFMRSDLSDIVDIITKNKMLFSISTNATLINENNISKIKSKNLVKVSVSIDGTETYHNMMRGSSSAFSRTINGIRILKKNNIKTAVAMVVTRNNITQIKDVLNIAINENADFFVINDLIPIGRGKEIENMCIPQNEYISMTKYMNELKSMYSDKINILWKGMQKDGPKDIDLGKFIISKCGAGLTEITIDNEGFVLPCPFLPKTSESVLKKSLKDIWFSSQDLAIYQDRSKLKGICGECGRSQNCSGCRARALAHLNNVYEQDIRCPLNLKYTYE